MILTPDLLHLVVQRGGHADCTVAAIATLLGLDYEWTLVACSTVRTNVLVEGLTVGQIQKAIFSLGVETKRISKYDIHEATGLLHLYKGKSPTKSRHQHAVILWAGRLIDCGGELWLNPEDYLKAKGYKAGVLITLV